MATIPRHLGSTAKVLYDPDRCMVCGAVVCAARNALGISQSDLASLLGVTRSTVVRLEQGIPPLKVALCRSVIEVFEKAGVTSNALKDVPHVSAGYPAVVDVSIEFHHLKQMRERLRDNVNSERLGKYLLGDDFVPPLGKKPLRRK